MRKPVEELFKNAPADATHYAKHCHYKVVGDTWMVHMHDNEWTTSDSMYNGQIKPSDIIARPTVKPWSGPEDGLPPVGIQVEIRNTKNRDCSPGPEGLFGKSVTVMACFVNMHDYDIVAVEGDDGGCFCFRADMCFPVKTAQQLAAEKRETAIREIMDVADVDCRVTAARLVDAGFKREVV